MRINLSTSTISSTCDLSSLESRSTFSTSSIVKRNSSWFSSLKRELSLSFLDSLPLDRDPVFVSRVVSPIPRQRATQRTLSQLPLVALAV